jgi:hypothetical protein
MLKDIENPEAVPARDPLDGSQRRRRGGLSRKAVLALVVAGIVASLTGLVWLTARTSAKTVSPAASGRQR